MAHVGTLHKPYIPGMQLPIGPICLLYALFIKPPQLETPLLLLVLIRLVKRPLRKENQTRQEHAKDMETRFIQGCHRT